MHIYVITYITYNIYICKLRENKPSISQQNLECLSHKIQS